MPATKKRKKSARDRKGSTKIVEPGASGKAKSSHGVIKRRKNGQFDKGGGPGRPPGMGNKTPARLIEKILEIEGQLTLEGKGLLDCARQSPMWFFEKILAKILPKSIDVDLGASDGEVKFEIIKKFELPKDGK